MSQTFWVYKDKSGIDYNLSLYHGDDSGHVVIYSGIEIIKIDFSVKSEKVYGFYLGEDFFELAINFVNRSPEYKLFISNLNKVILPQQNHNEKKKHTILALFIIIFFVSVMLVFIYSMVSSG